METPKNKRPEYKGSGPWTKKGIENVTKNLPKPSERKDSWGFSKEGKKAMARANHLNQLKHGLYASIPILCKTEECPYADACRLLCEGYAVYGEPCPIEASTIEDLVDKYSNKLGVEDDDIFKKTIIRDLVDADIGLTRCHKKLAISADVVERVVVAVTENGEPIRKPEVPIAIDLAERFKKQRKNSMNLLLATPKDRANTGQNVINDPSSLFAQMKSRLMEMKSTDEKNNTVEVKVTKSED